MTLQRIRKNSIKKINLIASRTTQCTIYTLSNYFRGEVFTPKDGVYDMILDGVNNRDTLVVDHELNTATLRQHSNSWVTLNLNSTEGL